MDVHKQIDKAEVALEKRRSAMDVHKQIDKAEVALEKRRSAMDVHKQIDKAEVALEISEDAGGNTQELRELRGAVHSLLKVVKHLTKKGKR